ncbi:MAG: aminotransferase [Shimia sp.]
MADWGRTAATFSPPVMEARRWLEGVAVAPDRPLLNVSQAAPVDPPPEALRREMARLVTDEPATHLYGPVLGLPALRREVAERWSASYGGRIAPEQVAITSGCNQAFAAAIQAICGEGDEVIVPTPFYFNHRMWLDMAGVRAVTLDTGEALIPDPAAAEARIGPRTRAIVLVTPNNPGGVEYPAATLAAFYDLCARRGVRLIVDETYRDFDGREGAAHDLFARDGWDRVLVHLYSFSKAYRLTGHRVGALVAGADLLAQAERFLDTVTICPTGLGQGAALWGMRHLGDWLASERAEILDRRAAIQDGFPVLGAQGWALLGCGAYFAYMRHPYDLPSDEMARRLVAEAGILLLPGTMFHPAGTPRAAGELRVAFANVDRAGMAQLFARLAAWRP